jgi:hypothetical protein
MAKKQVGIEVIEEGNEGFLVKTFDDGSEDRQPIVKPQPRKKQPRRLDRSGKLSSGLKRGF